MAGKIGIIEISCSPLNKKNRLIEYRTMQPKEVGKYQCDPVLSRSLRRSPVENQQSLRLDRQAVPLESARPEAATVLVLSARRFRLSS